jgi:hypothetical protein
MNIKFLPLVAASCLFAGKASAGDSAFEYEHTLTINLQLVSEGPSEEKNGPAGNTTETQSFVVEKYSNKEILQDLMESGVISSISGWTIVLVTDDEGDVSGFRLKKKNTPSIDLENLSLRVSSPTIEAYTGTTIARTRRYTATNQEINVSTFSLDARGIELEASGNFRTVFAITADSEEVDTKVVQNITCSNLSGYGSEYDNEWEAKTIAPASIIPVKDDSTFIVYGGFIASSVKKVEYVD